MLMPFRKADCWPELGSVGGDLQPRHPLASSPWGRLLRRCGVFETEGPGSGQEEKGKAYSAEGTARTEARSVSRARARWGCWGTKSEGDGGAKAGGQSWEALEARLRRASSAGTGEPWSDLKSAT